MNYNKKLSYGANVPIALNSCFYCGCGLDQFSKTVDHLIPESRGGGLSNGNKVPSCGDCNKLKGDMTPDEFRDTINVMIRFEAKSSRKKVSYLKKVRMNLNNLISSKTASDKKQSGEGAR